MKKRAFAVLLSLAIILTGIPTTPVLAKSSSGVMELTETEVVVEESVEDNSTEVGSAEMDITEVSSTEETSTEVSSTEVEEVETEVDTTSEEVTATTEETSEIEVVTTTEETEETDETGETEGTEETVSETEELMTEELTEEETTTEETTAEEDCTESVQMNGEEAGIFAVGRNGKSYGGVTYLSMKTFNTLPRNAQNAYFDMCDEIAELLDAGYDIRNVVITFEEGELKISFSAPMLGNKTAVNFNDKNEVETDIEVSSLLPDKGKFYDMLDGDERKYVYNRAHQAIIKNGGNSFSLNYRGFMYLADITEYVYEAVPALIYTYPNKFNWVDWEKEFKFSGGVDIQNDKSTWKVTIPKSKYYSSSLEEKTNTKVNKLVKEARAYAKTNYPKSPTYGIVKYFNNWLYDNSEYYANGTNSEVYGTTKEFYYSNSCYGPMLNGLGTGRGYALAMTRLLDAAGVRNVYVFGGIKSGSTLKEHSWNHVQMPNGKWYLLDVAQSDKKSSKSAYLLKAKDDAHSAKGKMFDGTDAFDFYSLHSADYPTDGEAASLSAKELYLKQGTGKKVQLCAANNDTTYYNKYPRTWTSSDKKVAKVDKNGKITAIAPGEATITCNVLGKEVSTTVYVYRFTGNRFTTNQKTTYKWEYGNPNKTFTSDDAKTFKLAVGQANAPLTAEQLKSRAGLGEPTAITSDSAIVNVSDVTLSDNTLSVKVTPKGYGTAKVTVSFAGKKSVLTVRVAPGIKSNWFDVSAIKDVEYSGKAIKPNVKLNTSGKSVSPKVTYKVVYENNKNAGTATVTIVGTGKYAGTITKEFAITRKSIAGAVFKSCSTSKVYNGKPITPTTVVKLGSKTLKAGVDYDVYFNDALTIPSDVGVYTISIKGKGNYKGTVTETKKFEIKATTIGAVSVKCPKTVKYTGKNVYPAYTVKIGKTDLPTKNYTVTYYNSAGNTVTAPKAIGQYTLVITPKGKNVLPTATKTNITKTFKVVE